MAVPRIFQQNAPCIKFGNNDLRREHRITDPGCITFRIIDENILTAGQNRVDAGGMYLIDNVIIALEMGSFFKIGVLGDGGELYLVVITDHLDISEAVESHILVENLSWGAIKYVFVGIVHIRIAPHRIGRAINMHSVRKQAL